MTRPRFVSGVGSHRLPARFPRLIVFLFHQTPTKTSEKARLSQSGVIQSLFHDKEAAPDNTDDAVKCDTDDADEDIHKDKA